MSALTNILSMLPLPSGQTSAGAMRLSLENGVAPIEPGMLEEMTSRLDLFHGYLGVFIVAFLVTVCVTPLMRRLAVSNGIIDHPHELRKTHRMPVAYLGGVAVYAGLLAGVVFSYFASDIGYSEHLSLMDFHESGSWVQKHVPFSIVLGMTVIMLTGLIDDVVGLAPRYKIGGQLLAAAAMAMQDVGTKVAAGVMKPFGAAIGVHDMVISFDLPFTMPMANTGQIQFDLVYWVGTGIIAIFILGACNASNLVDGLDGLLTGVTGIASIGLLVIALGLAAADDGPLDAARIVLCLALMGACLGFLPHNFNPATIFLGDCGSLLLGFTTIAVILSLGDTGRTYLVVAGLIIYAIPIIDTVLAIVPRKLAGKSLSEADDQHLHHQLQRSVGVKGAVFALYGIAGVFALLGVWLSMGRVRLVFTIAMVIAAFVGITAVKIARRQAIEAHALNGVKGPGAAPVPAPSEPGGDGKGKGEPRPT